MIRLSSLNTFEGDAINSWLFEIDCIMIIFVEMNFMKAEKKNFIQNSTYEWGKWVCDEDDFAFSYQKMIIIIIMMIIMIEDCYSPGIHEFD